jgi:hypothetical protein
MQSDPQGPEPVEGQKADSGCTCQPFLFSFCTYLATLARSITWRHDGADGGDLIAAAYTFGIPHPTGYPLYVLLTRLFTFLPWGDIAYWVNLMSAFFAAATIPLVCLASSNLLAPTIEMEEDPVLGTAEGPVLSTVEGWSDRMAALAPAVTAALAFAFSPVFWSQAVIAGLGPRGGPVGEHQRHAEAFTAGPDGGAPGPGRAGASPPDRRL